MATNQYARARPGWLASCEQIQIGELHSHRQLSIASLGLHCMVAEDGNSPYRISPAFHRRRSLGRDLFFWRLLFVAAVDRLLELDNSASPESHPNPNYLTWGKWEEEISFRPDFINDPSDPYQLPKNLSKTGCPILYWPWPFLVHALFTVFFFWTVPFLMHALLLLFYFGPWPFIMHDLFTAWTVVGRAAPVDRPLIS